MDIFAASTPDTLPLLDLFGTTADHRRYVPRAATERVLDELARCVEAGRVQAVLSGPPAIGKTLMLRVLAERLKGRRRCAYLPYSAVPVPALCAWALTLQREPPSYDPAGALIAHARRLQEEGQGLVLLIDNAETLAADTARGLYQAAQDSEGALSLVAAAEASAAAQLLAQWPKAQEAALLEPLSEAETVEYVSAHLRRLPAQLAERAGFDARVLSELYRATQGVPGRINAEAGRHVRRLLLGKSSHETPATRTTPGPAPAPAPAEQSPGIPALPPPPAWVLEEEAAERVRQAERLRRQPSAERPAAGGAGAIEQMLRETEVERVLPAGQSEESPASIPEELPASIPEESPASIPEESPVPKPKQVRAPTPQAVPAPPPSASAPTHAELPSGDPGFARAAGLLADAHRQTDSAPAAAESRAESGTRPQSAAPQREPLTAAPPQPIAPARDRIASVLAKLRVPNLAWSRAGAILLAAFVVAFAGTLLWMNQRRMETPDPAPLLEEAALPVPPPEPAPAPAAPPAAIVAEPVAVHINATPWATIRIDGVESGVTPLAGVNLSPGVHVFEALFPDGRAIERQVDISATNRFVAFE